MLRKGHIEAGKEVSKICSEMGGTAAGDLPGEPRHGGSGLNKVREFQQLREEKRKLKDCSEPRVGQTHSASGGLKKGLRPATRCEVAREIRWAIS